MIYGILILVMGGTLAFAPQFGDCYTEPKLLLAAIGTFLIWAALWRRGRLGLMFAKTPMDTPLLAMLGAMILSGLFTSDIGMTILGEYRDPMYGFLPLLLVAAVFYGFAQTTPMEDSDVAGSTLVACGGVIGLYAVAQRLGFDFAWWPTTPDGRAISTIGSPVYLGNVLAILVPVALGGILVQPKAAYGALGAFLAMLGGLWATGSRGGMLAAALGCAVAVYVHAGRRRKAIAGAMVAAAVVALLLSRHDSFKSDQMRLQTWKAAENAFVAHPIVGTGPGTFLIAMRKYRPESWLQNAPDTTVQGTAHNDLLQVASTLGAFGLIAYMLMHLGALLILMRTWSPVKAGLFGAFAAAIVAAKFNAIPFTGELALALLLGHAFAFSDRRLFDSVEYTAPWASIGVVISALIMLAYGSLAAADWNFESARGLMYTGEYGRGAAYMRRALALNPLEIEYRAEAAEQLIWLAQRTEGEDRAQLLTEGVRFAYDTIDLHAGNPMAWDMTGTAALFDALHAHESPDHAELVSALTNLNDAQAGDPLAMGLRRRRLQAAWTAGLIGQTHDIAREYARLAAVTNNKNQDVFKCSFCGRPWADHARITR